MKSIIVRMLFVCLVSTAGSAFGAADIEINTPAIAKLRDSLKQRHGELKPYYASGAVGLARDGTIALRDANSVPLAERQKLNAMVNASNQDRGALYREIAAANNHPEWEAEIRSTFAERWIGKAPAGWWVQDSQGGWKKK